jgi:hypothetical protein
MIPPEAKTVRLQLKVNPRWKKDRYANFRAEITTVPGEPILVRRGLSGRIRRAEYWVVLTIRTAALEERDYILTLRGVSQDGTEEDLDDYYFRIVKKG